MLKGWKCKRCGNTKTQGCGLPNNVTEIVYEDGSKEFVPSACPLEPVGFTKLYWNLRFKFKF